MLHAFGAAFDNPDLVVCCVGGDGEAETGPLAASWHSNKFLNPARDGAVLPVLHLNGYKIAGPTVLARIGRDELSALMHGYGYDPHYVEGDDPETMHRLMAAALDAGIDRIREIQQRARADGTTPRPLWPMIVLGCAGDVPTMEVLAAAALLRVRLPRVRVRVVNVVDLMTLQPESEHPHGFSDEAFDALVTADRPIIFAFHGYPALIHKLTYRRTNHGNLHVRGVKEEGTTTTPFDMTVRNTLDRFSLVLDVIARVPDLAAQADAVDLAAYCRARLREHEHYIREHGDDMPDVRDWRWGH